MDISNGVGKCLHKKTGNQIHQTQDDLVPWWNKCLQERAFYTPPDANGIDFDSLYDELSHRASLFNKNNPDPDSDSDTIPYNA